MDKKVIKDKTERAYIRFNIAIEQARQDLEDILRDCGGFIKTLPSGEKPSILAKTYDIYGNASADKVIVSSAAADCVL